MKANSFENLIADQKFKLELADKDISDYLEDCPSKFNSGGLVLAKIPVRKLLINL